MAPSAASMKAASTALTAVAGRRNLTFTIRRDQSLMALVGAEAAHQATVNY